MTTRITLLLILLLTATATPAESVRLSEPVQKDDTSETFGAPIDQLSEVIELSTLLASPDEFLDTSIAIRTRVAKVCQKKGCFFIAQQGKDTIRVAFKDYGFFVPTDISGRSVTLVGKLVARDVSPQQAAHFTKDLGGNAVIKSGQVYELVASSVRVSVE